MNNQNFYLVAAGIALALIAAYFALNQQTATETVPANDQPDTVPPPVPQTIMEAIAQPFNAILGLWRPPQPYADLILVAEQRYGIAPNILARLLYQESRYRADIIDGRTQSPAGALGIAQFMPATAEDLGIDPLDPVQAINAAGRYLSGLYRTFGNWSEALAAYNWGQGNVSRKGLAAAPAETQNYYAQILNDVNAANGTNLS